jgi:MFS family permease
MLALIPIIYLVYNIVYATLSQPLGGLADRVGKKQVLFAGYVISALMCLGFAYANSQLFAWILFIIYGIAMAITQTAPRALLADLVHPEVRGTAYGFYYTLIGFVALPTSAIAGFLWDRFSPAAAFSYGAGAAFIAAVLLFILIPGPACRQAGKAKLTS